MSVAKNGHCFAIRCSKTARAFFSPPVRKASMAEPKPYQPGRATRHWPQLKLHGIARRSSIAWLGLREAGREPMLSSAISRMGVALKK